MQANTHTHKQPHTHTHCLCPSPHALLERTFKSHHHTVLPFPQSWGQFGHIVSVLCQQPRVRLSNKPEDEDKLWGKSCAWSPSIMADTVTDTDSCGVRDAEDGKEEDRFSLWHNEILEDKGGKTWCLRGTARDVISSLACTQRTSEHSWVSRAM